ncbi:MAG: lysoplasmalogenase [Gemmatimonadetes bacterium]|nr:lysoplasmalogenase [Gemmatimonadota bacterium]MBP7550182.1 lysoplasmalogenase [Gemmatimonadaceae bacterium]
MSALLLALALACIAGEYLDLPVLIYVTKPLATLITIAIAVRATNPVSPRYRTLVTAGLVASLAGDVFLMLPGDRFIAGLASFLVAHLLYIAAFAGAGGGLRSPASALPVGVFALAMLATLWPELGALRLPVAAYVMVIAAMGWQALARWGRSPGAELAALGAVSFLVSDSALAVGRFMGPFGGDRALVLGTYWLAQWCIARSVAGPGRFSARG